MTKSCQILDMASLLARTSGQVPAVGIRLDMWTAIISTSMFHLGRRFFGTQVEMRHRATNWQYVTKADHIRMKRGRNTVVLTAGAREGMVLGGHP